MTPHLIDPPELAQYAARGDPPMARWPGQWVRKEAVMAACGDERDWFRFHHRYRAYRQAWGEFCDARRRRRRFSSGFDWNQALIIGEYGAKKTTLGIKVAYEFFRRGHPVFSNASVLFGWHLEHEEMYTAMGFMPKHSVLLIDEGSAALSSRVGHGVSVSTFSEMNLNTRKQNCIVIYMTAHDWEMAASIRQHCKEVWKPLPSDLVSVGRNGQGVSGLHPADDPDNFTIAWDVWGDSPYSKRDLIEGKKEEEGFGPPEATYYDEGETVRNAYLLNDTFELAKVGSATTSDRDVVKSALDQFLNAQTLSHQEAGAPPARLGQDHKVLRTVEFFMEQMESGGKDYYRAGDVAKALGVSTQEAGQLIQRAFPIEPHRRKGYSADQIFTFIEKMSDASDAATAANLQFA